VFIPLLILYSRARSGVVNERGTSWDKIAGILGLVSVFLWRWDVFLGDQVVD